MIVFALSTGHAIGLGIFGAAFIVFALVSAMVIPRFRPDFPRNLGGFIALTVCFFAAMLFAVFYFGRESHASTETQGAAQPATTTTQQQPSTGTTATSGGSQAALAQGKSIFTSAGCSGCHTLKAAGASGTVGPNLDQLKPSEQRIVTQVTNGGAIMPSFKGRLSSSQIQAVAAYVSSAAGKS